MAFTQSLRWLLISVIKTTLKDNTKTEEGWEWEEVRGISGGHPSLSIPAKWRGGHQSADKDSQATVFSVQSIDTGLAIPQEPFIVHEHFDSIYICVFPRSYCVCLKAEDCSFQLDFCGPAGM